MKMIIFFFLILFLLGCAVYIPEETTLVQPTLLKQSQLPPIKESVYNNYSEFYCEMHIDKNGDVEKAKLLKGTGDTIWDSLAVQSLLKWKYTPAIYNGVPIKMVVRKKVKVVFVEPKFISLAEIELPNFNIADSVYKALKRGEDFFSLVLKYSISPTRNKNGILGQINIEHFSDQISAALDELDEEEFTKPLSYGEHYMIYKRLKLNN